MQPERRHYIDWVRVLAFSILIFFHCAMPFVQWRLPLLFFISGVGIYFSLRRRSVISFAGERFVKLFIPLAFAMLFTIPSQVYFEWRQAGNIHMSYAEFWPSVWKFVPYPDGSLTWSHMWFVVYLFVFCILLLPFFAILKIKAVAEFKQRLANRFGNPILAGLLFIPLMAYYLLLYLKYPEQQNLFDDWFLFVFSLTLLLYGYFVGSSDRFWKSCEKYRFWYLGIAVTCIVILFYFYWWNFDYPKEQGSGLYYYGLLNSLHIWCWILGMLGLAKHHLNFTNKFLRYANQAVYPFYILHQTLIVGFGYYVTQWSMPILPKLVILMVLTFVSLLLIYRFLIKPFIIPRILFGLKPKEKKGENPAVP